MSDNPFLLPPDGAKRPVVPPVPNPAPAPAPAHYIAVPASVESVTHRIARPAPEPGQPVPEPERPVQEPAVPAAAADVPVAEETRLSLPAPQAWALVLPEGTRLNLVGPLLLGRDPAPIPDRPEARLLPLADFGKTVSKTHALLEATPEGVRVRDLHSTNGVAIDTAAGRQILTAGSAAVAPLGATIMLGSFPLVVAAS